MAKRGFASFPYSQHSSDLRACSKDNHNTDEEIYLFERAGIPAINFDGVMRSSCVDEGMARLGRPFGTARSVDALYVGRDTGTWDDTIALIEFKNGNLMERPQALVSSRVRSDLCRGIIDEVDTILTNNMASIGYGSIERVSMVVDRAVQSQVSSIFGRRRSATGGSRGEGYNGDHPRIEEVKTKAACSGQEVLDDRAIPSVSSIEDRLPSLINRCATSPLRRFGLWDSLGVFFHEVLTLTPEEAEQCVGT